MRILLKVLNHRSLFRDPNVGSCSLSCKLQHPTTIGTVYQQVRHCTPSKRSLMMRFRPRTRKYLMHERLLRLWHSMSAKAQRTSVMHLRSLSNVHQSTTHLWPRAATIVVVATGRRLAQQQRTTATPPVHRLRPLSRLRLLPRASRMAHLQETTLDLHCKQRFAKSGLATSMEWPAATLLYILCSTLANPYTIGLTRNRSLASTALERFVGPVNPRS